MQDLHREVARDLGRHDAEIDALRSEIQRVHRDMASMLEQLAQINQTLAEAKGGWRTLIAAAGIASAVTAGAVKLLGYIPWR